MRGQSGRGRSGLPALGEPGPVTRGSRGAASFPTRARRRRGQVLGTLSQTFTIFEPSDTLGRDLLVLFGIGAVHKLLFAALFLAKTRGGSPPAPPAGAALRA